MATNIQPLKDAIKLISDVVLDSIKAAGETSASAKLADFGNVFGDIMTLIPEIGEVPSPATLSPSDYAELVETLAADLALPGKPGAIVTASLKTLTDIVTVIVPDCLAIADAARS